MNDTAILYTCIMLSIFKVLQPEMFMFMSEMWCQNKIFFGILIKKVFVMNSLYNYLVLYTTHNVTVLLSMAHSMHSPARVWTSHAVDMGQLAAVQKQGLGLLSRISACSVCKSQGAAPHSWDVFRLCLGLETIRFNLKVPQSKEASRGLSTIGFPNWN